MLNLINSPRSPFSSNPDADALPPAELGLPERYSHWRVNQYEAVERILTSPKRFIAICAPCGFGKSLLVAGAAVLSGRRTAVLTMTRGLQDQYSAELGEVFADIRGLANYTCPIATRLGIADTTTVADAPCQCGYACQLKRTGGCGYYDSYRAAQRADAFSTNYQCWLHDSRKDPEQSGNLQFGMDADAGSSDRPVGLLFCDEAHDVCDALGMFLGEDLSRRECLQLHLSWPDSGWTIEQWRGWADEQLDGVTERLRSLEKQTRNAAGRGWTRELKHLRDMKRKLDRLSAMRAEDEWIITESDRNAESGNAGSSSTGSNGNPGNMSAVRFDPLNPARYAEQALFRGIEKIVLVSATVRPKTAQMLGISREDLEFIEYPSTFAVGRRPIIHIPSVQLNYRNEQDDGLMQQWLSVIDSILEPRIRLGRKGLIHAVSYSRAKFIVDNSEHSWCMMMHNSHDRAKIVEEFRRADGPRVLVSPSIDTGYDFAGDQARFQLIVKIPFASVRDPVVKARQNRDKDYNMYQVAQTIIQASGRAVRSESDWAETFIVDDALAWSFPRMRAGGFLAKWWLDAFRSVDDIPLPIEFPEEK